MINYELAKDISLLYDKELSKYPSISELFNKFKEELEIIVYNPVYDAETAHFHEMIVLDIVKKLKALHKYEETTEQIIEFIVNPNFKFDIEASNYSLSKSNGNTLFQTSLQDSFYVRKVSSTVFIKEDTTKGKSLIGPKHGISIKVDRILIKDGQNMSEKNFIVKVEKLDVDLRKYDAFIKAEINRLEAKNIDITPKIKTEIERKARLLSHQISSLDSYQEKKEDRFNKMKFIKNWYEFMDDFRSEFGIRLDENQSFGEDQTMMMSRWATTDYLVLDNRKKRKGEIINITDQLKKTMPQALKKTRR